MGHQCSQAPGRPVLDQALAPLRRGSVRSISSCGFGDIPFYYLRVTKDTKLEQKNTIWARAIRYHLDGRVILNSHKTIVFTD